MYGHLGLGDRFARMGAAGIAGTGSISVSTSSSTAGTAHAAFNLLLALTN